MELLISDKEHAMLKTQTPFSDEVTSVEFFADTRLLVLIFSNTASVNTFLQILVVFCCDSFMVL